VAVEAWGRYGEGKRRKYREGRKKGENLRANVNGTKKRTKRDVGYVGVEQWVEGRRCCWEVGGGDPRPPRGVGRKERRTEY
jgi:hypothetical protein